MKPFETPVTEATKRKVSMKINQSVGGRNMEEEQDS